MPALEVPFGLDRKPLLVSLVPQLQCVHVSALEKQKEPPMHDLVARRGDCKFLLDGLPERAKSIERWSSISAGEATSPAVEKLKRVEPRHSGAQ